MSTSFLVQTAGPANIAAGLFLLAFWWLFVILLPYREMTDSLSILALHRHWRWVNTLGVLGALCGIVGLPGLYAAWAPELGRVGAAGYCVTLVGSCMLLGTLLWDTIIWPILAHQDPHLLDFTGPIYRSRLFLGFFVSAGLLWGLGYLTLGVAALRAEVWPPWMALSLAVGAPLFALGSAAGSAQAIPRTVGICLVSAALIGVGFLLRSAPGLVGGPGS